MQNYLHLRLLLLGRLLREVGWWRLVLVLPILALALMQGLVMAAGHPLGRWAVPVVVAASVLSAHRRRDDWQFLATAAPGFRVWLAVEYAVASLPVGLLLLVLRAWGAAALTLALVVLVGWAPPARAERASRQRIRSPFRSEAFEWVSGVRASYGLLLWPVLLAGAVWQRASPLGPIAALLVWLLVVAGYYSTPEPVPMLLLAARSPKQFLRRRLGLSLGYAAVTALPVGLLLGWGPAGWVGAGAALLFWLLLLGMVVLAKYAFYPNATHVRTTQGLVLALGLLGAWHPAYPPVMLVILGGLIWQSCRRLREIIRR
ncbi:MAG: hypothetical protein ACRYFX_17105 [Janthinobacterium lividum]